jgi:ATP-dependent DNA helicase RecQ
MVDDNPEQSRIMLHKLSQMATLCEANACRRRAILNYFDEEAPEQCGSCDVCLTSQEKVDCTIIAQKALSAVARLENRYGLTYVVDFLRGSKSEKIHGYHKDLKTYGIGKDISKEDWYHYFKDLISFNYLKQSGSEYPILMLTEKSRDVLAGKEKVFLVQSNVPSQTKTSDSPERSEEPELFGRLKNLRLNLAQNEDVPAYLIFSDATLLELATYLPQTMEDIRKISGFGEIKLAKYGQAFLETVVDFCHQRQLPTKIHEKIPKRERK